MATLDERVARVHLALYTRLMGHVRAASNASTRQFLETALVVVLLHAVALLALLHVSFVSPADAAQTSCLSPFLPLAAADTHLLRIQISPLPSCALGAPACVEPPSRPLASFVFASQQELLALRHSPSMLQLPNGSLPVATVARASECFDLRGLGQSSPLWDLLLDHALGYDTILVNHLMRWRGAGGVLLNEVSGGVHDVGATGFVSFTTSQTWLAFAVSKVQTLYLCVSLFFTCVTLVGFLVHELFARSLVFSDLTRQRHGFEDYGHYTHTLGVHCAHSLAVFPIVLGMVFFFLELYKQDYVLAFGVLMIIAIGESYSIICVRTPLSRLYYPPLFFCWFALFHIFLCAYPHGFSHLALLVLALAQLHSIVFFTNCFELPNFLAGTRHHRT